MYWGNWALVIIVRMVHNTSCCTQLEVARALDSTFSMLYDTWVIGNRYLELVLNLGLVLLATVPLHACC